jgi:predicted cobalt transporter CbtA
VVRALLVRGLVAGLIAGLIAAVFAFFVGEPYIDQAIALEEEGHGHEPLVSRSGQQAGLFLAVGLYGMCVGGIFALSYAWLRGRIGPRSDRALAVRAAGAAFIAVVLVPFLKYPANPPAVGDPETFSRRTVLYLVMVAVSLLALAAGLAYARMMPRHAWLGGSLCFAVPVAVAWWMLPGTEEVPDGFPAALLWDFRISSLGTQLVLWLAIGVLFGLAAQRVPD